jgi:hypothetical protein
VEGDGKTVTRTGGQPDGVVPEFEVSRAVLSEKDLFPTFHAETALPLKEVLAKGDVRENTHVLVSERSSRTLALLTHQMTYHHVAQGEMFGEPWMVSF